MRRPPGLRAGGTLHDHSSELKGRCRELFPSIVVVTFGRPKLSGDRSRAGRCDGHVAAGLRISAAPFIPYLLAARSVSFAWAFTSSLLGLSERSASMGKGSGILPMEHG
jgi:hypothetical protein